ncbi:MAG: DMT family transporter, partial [Bryobacteraceae bacterium]
TSATLYGDFIVLLAALTFSLFTVMSKRLRAKFDGLTLNTFAYVGGGLSILPMTLWLLAGFSLRDVSWTVWASILYMGIFPSVVCYLIYYYALGHISASRVSAFSYLQPLVATLLAIPTLGEHPTKSLVAGGALVLLGVFITERT